MQQEKQKTTQVVPVMIHSQLVPELLEEVAARGTNPNRFVNNLVRRHFKKKKLRALQQQSPNTMPQEVQQ